MATKAFGVKDLRIEGTGTPTIESPSGGDLQVTAATTTFSGNIVVNGTMGGSAGKVINVWTDNKGDAVSTNSTNWTDVSGLDVTLTPNNVASQFLIIANINLSYNNSSGHDGLARLVKLTGGTTTAIGNGTGASDVNRQGFAQVAGQNSYYQTSNSSITYLDDANTTSSITYKIQIRCNNGSYKTYVNRRSAADDFRTSSSITVMELSS